MVRPALSWSILPESEFMTPWGQPRDAQSSRTSCLEFRTGRLSSNTASIRLKMAVLAPMPSASVSTATAVKARFVPNMRTPYRKSWSSVPIVHLVCCQWSAVSGQQKCEMPLAEN